MTRTRAGERKRHRRRMRLGGTVAVVTAVLAGTALVWTGNSEPFKAEALIPARFETRAPADVAASSASSGAAAEPTGGARSLTREARSTARDARSAARELRAASREARSPKRAGSPSTATREPDAVAAPSEALTATPTAPSTAAPSAARESQPTPPQSAPAVAPAPSSGAGIDGLTSRAIFKAGPYRQSNNVPALKAAELERQGRVAEAALIREISSQPISMWIGDWMSSAALSTHLTEHKNRAAAAGTTPVFVTYAIPGRDCGGHSAGGLDPAAYLQWNKTVAQHLAGSGAVMIVEPDALALLGSPQCAAHADQRLSLLRQTVDILSGAGLVVYLDAGHSAWVPADTMAARLKEAGVGSARGFAVNVSNYNPTANEVGYGDRLSGLLGGKHYVVDTSRNGARVSDWCNAPGAALGQNPTVSTTGGALDALLWVKAPGESDGTCNGGPAAGQWFERYAMDLARNRP